VAARSLKELSETLLERGCGRAAVTFARNISGDSDRSVIEGIIDVKDGEDRWLVLCCLTEGDEDKDVLAVEVPDTAVLLEVVEKDDLADLVEGVDPPE
jgi:hypothetical protein